MNQAAPSSLRRRDQNLLLASFLALVLLAWAYLFYLNDNMIGMHAGLRPWTIIDCATMFLMWTVMMVGMMVPSAMRAVLIFARIAARGQHEKRLIAPAYIFGLGYLLIWTLFSAAATVLQWGLERAALLSPMMVSSSNEMGAALLIAAGMYQLTPLKDVCLKHCQSPVMFLADNYKRGLVNAVLLGLKHGSYCLGCCWVLMGLLFLGGVMNLLWILAISLFVCAEKLLPSSVRSTQLSGGIMIVAGIIYFAGYTIEWS